MRWIDVRTGVVLYASLYTENITGIIVSEGKMTQTHAVRMILKRGERGDGRKGETGENWWLMSRFVIVVMMMGGRVFLEDSEWKEPHGEIPTHRNTSGNNEITPNRLSCEHQHTM
jgi:hypothetical protein